MNSGRILGKVIGERTDCLTGEKTRVELGWDSEAGVHGTVFRLVEGPTGYESFYIDKEAIERMSSRGWCACMGDVGCSVPRHDKLEIPAEEMAKAFKELRICPQCHKYYKPVLGQRPEGDNRCIQDIFPNAKPWEREQLLTGICSDECWKKYLKVDDENDEF